MPVTVVLGQALRTATLAVSLPWRVLAHICPLTAIFPCQTAADVLLAKDILQHWSNADILALIPKLSSFRMALITNGFHPAGMTRVNDIKPEGWRPIDLQRSPFSVPGSYVYWFNGGEPKYVFLWHNPTGHVAPSPT